MSNRGASEAGQEDYRPKWLQELENRKRKQRLGHEVGAGAPCLSCESSCPGLDLHFWRKICKNCKCRGDEHDFDDDEFPQFELLFGPNVKSRRKNNSVLLKVNDKKQTQEETSFEWVPPDTTEELAADYMKALPLDKLPISGSSGAAFRKQQLQKQLPLHDIDHTACAGLDDDERKEFDKYLNNLKRCAGQGRVSKLMTIRPFDQSLMTPANATDVQRFSPQHSQQLTRNNGTSSLRTPSSFIPKGLPDRPSPDTAVPPGSSEPVYKFASPVIGSGPMPADSSRYHHALANVSCNASLAQSTDVPAGVCHSPGCPLTPSRQQLPSPCELRYSRNPGLIASEERVQVGAAGTARAIRKARVEGLGGQVEQGLEFSSELPAASCAQLAEQMLSEALLPPSNVNAGDIVGSSLDEDGLAHIRGKLSDKYGNGRQAPRDLVVSGQHPSAAVSASEDIKRCSAEIAKEFESKPTTAAGSPMDVSAVRNNQSVYGTRAERLPVELNTSLPVQSSLIHSEALNNPVFPEEAVGGASTVYQNQEHIDQLQNELQAMKMSTHGRRECTRCEDDIYPGQVVVTADKIKDAVWHPGCFKCCACNELLVDLVYFTYKGRLYCGRDLAKLLEIPRCHACDELIFVREYTVAEGNNYHVKHFCCWDCDTPLANRQYVTENDRPLCLPCYQKYYAKTCNACDSVIAADQQGVAVKGLDFHANDTCFCCFTCKKSLLGGQIAVKENKLLCSKECIAEFLQRKKMGR